MKELRKIYWRNGGIAAHNLAQIQQETLDECRRAMKRRYQGHRLIFSHTTGLRAEGIEVPRIDRKFNQSLLHAASYLKTGRSRMEGISFHQWGHSDELIRVDDDVRCLSPVTLWMQMAPYLTQDELVVLGDSMMRKSTELKRANLSDFQSAIANSTLFHGKAKCLRALAFMMEGTDSSQESRLREVFRKAKYEDPVVNAVLRDPERGDTYFLDIAYPKVGLILEYDGSQHADWAQRKRDIDKRKRCRELGWVVIEVKDSDLNSETGREQIVESAGIQLRMRDPKVRWTPLESS